MKNQKGFFLLGLIIAFGFATAAFTMMADRIYLSQVKSQQVVPFLNRLSSLQESIKRYQLIKIKSGLKDSDVGIFPPKASLENELVKKGLWESCTNADKNNGLCTDLLNTPYNSKIDYNLSPTSGTPPVAVPIATFEIPLPNINSEKRLYNLYLSELSKLANSNLSSDRTKLILRLYPVTNYPSLDTEKFITSDGNTILKDTWDVGNKAVLNASQISVKTSNGSQLDISRGTISEMVVPSGTTIYKTAWSCPVGLEPKLNVNVHSVLNQNTYIQYIGINGFTPIVEDHGNRYIVKLRYNAKRKSDSKWHQHENGYLNVRLGCY
ncbi:hypothetical protein [Photobacterium aquae]|uniref:hypothetical protein n=1 Tax=Photobacterium aquae TaxID=1195763 RepID=UPI00069DC377|nr:hypothetical protein [Photobacterium aquae]